MKVLEIIAFVLLIIGGINWGLVGVFHFNLVEAVFGHFPVVVQVVYGLVGVSALYAIYDWVVRKGGCCDKV